MYKFRKMAVLIGLVVALPIPIVLISPAFADAPVQLLPPTVATTGGKCTFGIGNLLTMTDSGADSQHSAINCVSGATLNSAGSLTVPAATTSVLNVGAGGGTFTGAITGNSGASFGNNVVITNGGFSVAGTSNFTGGVTFGGGASFGDYGLWAGTNGNREWMGKCTGAACALPFAGQDYMHISGWTNANYGLNPGGQTTTRVLGLFDTVVIPGGKLAVGTDHPSSILDIRSASGTSPAAIIDSVGAAANNSSDLQLFTQSTGSGALNLSSNQGWQISARGSQFVTPDQSSALNFSFWNGSTWSNGMWITPSGNVGIGSSPQPGGNLDVENGSGTATICLNGQCVTHLGGNTGAQGLQGPAGPQGAQGPQGPAGPSGSAGASCSAASIHAALNTFNPAWTYQTQTPNTDLPHLYVGNYTYGSCNAPNYEVQCQNGTPVVIGLLANVVTPCPNSDNSGSEHDAGP
jgi:hypothetical protein